MRTKRRILTVAVLPAVSGVLLLVLPMVPPNGEPLLSGPPEFIILLLFAALALYLRQVNLNASDLRYKIRHGELWDVQPERKYQTEKLGQLQWTSDTIMNISPFLFALILIVCAKIIYDSLCRFYYAPKVASPRLYILDCLIVTYLSFNFVGLTIAHFVLRYKDDDLQEKIKAEADSTPHEA